MKHSDISKVMASGILAAGLVITSSTLPALAQSSTSPQTRTTSTTDNTSLQGSDRRDNDHSNWGWLGVVGLAGLAGLAKGNSSERSAYRDPNATR